MRTRLVLKFSVAFEGVQHNARWVQRCMQRAWQAEEIPMRELGFSEESRRPESPTLAVYTG